MDIVVLKFGGSSVANNKNLETVANKIIDFKKRKKDVVCIVSAQGKMTDNLINEAKELSKVPNERELDALINVGEQISASKLSILLNEKGYKAISLNGCQAGILTNNKFQNAKIFNIDTKRIINELDSGKIVVVTGFQGVNENGDITTLGRGGSDTSAVAIASVLKAKNCYIFSDVDGIYTADPNKIDSAKKIKQISYKEMSISSNEGAKVLHDRCVELAEKYNLPIIAGSTFSNENGTIISNDTVEKNEIKSIIQNDNIVYVTVDEDVLEKLLKNDIKFGEYIVEKDKIHFTILKDVKDKLIKVLKNIKVETIDITKISIIGIGISNNSSILKEIIPTIENIRDNIISIDVSAYKISIQFNKIVDKKYLNEIHKKLIK